MKRRTIVSVVTAASSVAGLVWWYVRQSPAVVHAETLVRAYDANDICFNVLYTAALYTTDADAVTLDTWTYSSLTSTVLLREWMLLKKRHQMMEKAFERLGASAEARKLYMLHRQECFSKY